jgi:hypothetical protein
MTSLIYIEQLAKCLKESKPRDNCFTLMSVYQDKLVVWCHVVETINAQMLKNSVKFNSDKFLAMCDFFS